MNGGAEELDDEEVVTEWVTPCGKVTFDPKKRTTKTEWFDPPPREIPLKKKYRKS